MKINTIRGFTLVEVALVLAIIGLLAAIAIPNFVKAREHSKMNACIANLVQIEHAKKTWALETKSTNNYTPTAGDLFGERGYIRYVPTCSAGGTYTIGALGVSPTCSYINHVISKY